MEPFVTRELTKKEHRRWMWDCFFDGMASVFDPFSVRQRRAIRNNNYNMPCPTCEDKGGPLMIEYKGKTTAHDECPDCGRDWTWR